MTGRNANIYFSEQTYNKLRQTVGTKISRFVCEAVEEKIQRVEQQKKEQLRKQLIKDYQANAKNPKLRAELAIWDETVEDVLSKVK
jgi:hypothetical protein